MEEKIKNNNIKIIIVVFVTVALIIAALVARNYFTKEEPRQEEKKEEKKEENMDNINTDFNIDIIKNVNKSAGTNNYLVSPYNIELALNMLRDGADGKSKEELDRVLGNRKINEISTSNNINVANGLFIKDSLKSSIKKEYTNTLKTKYNSEIVYDELKTPDVINKWANNKTNGMIKKVLDNLNINTILVLASALSIDVKWNSEFDCAATKSDKFTKADNTTIDVEMMHKTYETSEYKYIKTNDAEGIAIPYKSDNNIELEFIGIIPQSDVDSYVNSLTKDKLNEVFKNQKEAGNKYNIILSLPRFTYDYEVDGLSEIMKNMGIKDVFDEQNADLSKMIETKDISNAYVDQITHNTRIELNEAGTKAAAVTAIVVAAKGAMPNNIETVNVEFNKPFVYLIREKNTGEILFFGVVYEPNAWNGSTCDNQ